MWRIQYRDCTRIRVQQFIHRSLARHKGKVCRSISRYLAKIEPYTDSADTYRMQGECLLLIVSQSFDSVTASRNLVFPCQHCRRWFTQSTNYPMSFQRVIRTVTHAFVICAESKVIMALIETTRTEESRRQAALKHGSSSATYTCLSISFWMSEYNQSLLIWPPWNGYKGSVSPL